MEKKKQKNQDYQGMWDVVFDGSKEIITKEMGEKVIKHIEENNIDINEVPPELKELEKIFEHVKEY